MKNEHGKFNPCSPSQDCFQWHMDEQDKQFAIEAVNVLFLQYKIDLGDRE